MLFLKVIVTCKEYYNDNAYCNAHNTLIQYVCVL